MGGDNENGASRMADTLGYDLVPEGRRPGDPYVRIQRVEGRTGMVQVVLPVVAGG